MDKTKISQTAIKYTQRGQYDKAIAEYRKIVTKDPKDVRSLLKIGELQQKKGDTEAAVATLLGVAGTYAQEGFFLKAVAVYKQVTKLAPERVDVILRLADLYKQLGLMSESQIQLRAAVEHYEKTGDVVQSAEILRQLVALEPENVAARLRLADALARQDDRTAALEELRSIAQSLRGGSRIEDYLRVAERIVVLDPHDTAVGKELARAYLAKRDVRRALERLQACFQAEPRDPETLQLLADAFTGVNQHAKAASVYKELARVQAERGLGADERASWKKVLELAPNDPDALQALGEHRAVVDSRGPEAPSPPVVPPPELSPAATQQRTVTRPVAPPRFQGSSQSGKRARSDVRPPPPERSASAPAPEASQPGELERLLTETDVFIRYGLVEKARLHLEKVFALDPRSIAGHEKAAALHRDRDPERYAAALASAARICAETGEWTRGRAHLAELQAADPDHEAVAELSAEYQAAPDDEVFEAEVVAEELPDDDEPILPVAADEEPVVLDDAVVRAAEAPSFQPIGDDALVALITETGDAEEVVEEPLLSDPSLGPGRAAVFDAGDAEDEPIVEVREHTIDTELEAPPAEHTIDLELAPAADEVVADLEEETVIEVGPAPESTSDFADEVPMVDGPDEPLEMSDAGAPFVVEETGREQTIDLDLPGGEENVISVEDTPVGLTAPDFERTPYIGADETVPVHFDANTVVADLEPRGNTWRSEEGISLDDGGGPANDANPWGEATGDLAAELEEAAFYLRQGMLDDAEEIYRSLERRAPGHAQVLEGLQAIASRREEPQDAPAAEATVYARATTPGPSLGSVGPASEQLVEAEAEGDDLFDLGAALAQEIAEATPPQPEASGRYGADDVLQEFKAGIARSVRPEDVETHYNIAIAYKEMGLLQEAIESFQQALLGCDGEPKAIDCLTMIGLSHLQLGEPLEAVIAFERGLAQPKLTPETEKALHYEIGQAWEAAEDLDEALAAYGNVARLDGDYRDVKAHIARLVAQGARPRQSGGSRRTGS